MTESTYKDNISTLKDCLATCDAVVIGAGAGLSTAAGYRYSGEIFDRWFGDFGDKYGIRDIYSGGFYPFPDMEEYWAWWSRHIWVNRYQPIPTDLYDKLLKIVDGKDYFVITTNVDHCFQRAGFDKKRLFYTQGDYGLLQSSRPHGKSKHKTYDNEEIVRNMLIAQGFEISDKNELIIPEGKSLSEDEDKGILMRVPTDMVPYCPDDGELMTTNLRADDTFVEDDGWYEASDRYTTYIKQHKHDKVLFLELGVGGNTPGIIKYPFWRMTAQNEHATYTCINMGEAVAPREIMEQSILLDADIYKCVDDLLKCEMIY